jgi:hypothetical protein
MMPTRQQHQHTNARIERVYAIRPHDSKSRDRQPIGDQAAKSAGLHARAILLVPTLEVRKTSLRKPAHTHARARPRKSIPCRAKSKAGAKPRVFFAFQLRDGGTSPARARRRRSRRPYAGNVPGPEGAESGPEISPSSVASATSQPSTIVPVRHYVPNVGRVASRRRARPSLRSSTRSQAPKSC